MGSDRAVDEILERDLTSCMHCRFFYGNSAQCIKADCIKQKSEQKQNKDERDICYQCPYKQGEKYCFPCMKKILGIDKIESEECAYEKNEL